VSPSRAGRRPRSFERRAPLYDLQLPLERRPLAAAAALVGSLAGLRVLDLASGTGALAEALLTTGGAPHELVVVDRSPAMLRRARGRLAERVATPPLRIELGDALGLGYRTERFDLVTIGYLLHLLGPPDAAAVLDEARRVLRPGGRLATVVHSPPPTPAGRLYGRIWRALTDVPAPAAGQRTPADARPIVERAGFEVRAERHVAAGYWSQVLVARRP